MNYLQRNRNHNRYGQKLLGLLGIFLVLFLFLKLTAGFWLGVLTPVWQAENALSRYLRSVSEYWKTRTTLAEENISLRERVSSLELENATLSLELESGRKIYDLLGRERREGEILATVLTRPPQSPYDLIVIDAGEREGISTGAQVFMPEGVMLGRVYETNSSSAKIRLLSTFGEKFEAVLERDNSPVILEGRGAGNFRMKISREILVEKGDRIVTADLGYHLIAIVEEVRVEATDSFQEVLARFPGNIFNLRLVSVTK